MKKLITLLMMKKNSVQRRFGLRAKCLLVFALCLTILSLVVAVGDLEAAEPKVISLIVSVPGTPRDPHVHAWEIANEKIKELSDGTMEIKLFHSGQLFTQAAGQEAVSDGRLDLTTTAVAFVANYAPGIGFLSAAFTFSDYDHLERVMSSEIGKEVLNIITEAWGARPLGAWYLGIRQLNLRDIGHEVRTPQDMRGVALRVPDSPDWLAMGRALGAEPTPLAFGEVYTALQTGTVDGQDNPLESTKNNSFHEVTKYIILTGHQVGFVLPTISKSKWESLTEQQQDWLLQAIEAGAKYSAEENLKAEEELLEFFESQGLIIIEPDLDAFRAYAKESYATTDRKLSEKWDMDLYERVQALK